MKTKRLFAFLLALVMSLGLVLPAFAEGIETDPAEIGETAEQAFGDAATLESVNNDPEPHRANLEDGYYLIGLNGWTVDDINAKDKLTQNPGNASEYWIKTTVAVGQEFKVAHIVDGQIGDDGWMYGAGDGNGNYRITSDTPSGAVTIYFRNTWNNDWNGYVYVGQNYVLTINASDNGRVSANIDTANVSTAETVVLTVAPAAGYLLDSLTVDGADVTASVANGNYSFKMPGHDVTVSAQFAKIPYPTAAVVEIAPAAKNVPLYDIATQQPIGTVDELEAEYSFTPDNPTSEQITYYGLWHADYRISFNQDIAKDTFGLYGKYFGYGVNLEAAFQFPTDLKAGEEVYLLGSIGFDDALNYNDSVNNIQEFQCGVYNLSEDNWGKTISVDLVIWDGSDPDTRIVVSTTDYTFKGKAKLNITEAPELPKANVEKITPTEMVKIGEDDQKLEAEYKFTPVEPTAIQLAYYGGWRADYRVSMNADTAAESFGLYGAYNGYGQEFKQGFLFPVPLTANEPIQLLTSAGLSSVTYDDVVNNIGEFICGVFNKSADNVGKTFKVELIIWDENDANAEPAVLATTTYTFVNQIPPLPKASIEEITENKDTNIPVYNPSTFAETGEVVEELGAEYKFTPD
ncbi:MAG: hypothetical protein II049_02180, partial [Clostridia bacterium]|nr:hypothetical protein [Clostridia bacterium]